MRQSADDFSAPPHRFSSARWKDVDRACWLNRHQAFFFRPTLEKLRSFCTEGSDTWLASFPEGHRRLTQHKMFTYAHAMTGLWQFISRCVEKLARDREPYPSDLLGDFDRASHVVLKDAEERNLGFPEIDDIPGILKEMERQFEAVTNIPVDAAALYEAASIVCRHVPPSTVIAYGLLLSPYPRSVIGDALLPTLHNWVHLLLGLPRLHDDKELTVQELLQENIQLRLHASGVKRSREDLELRGSAIHVIGKRLSARGRVSPSEQGQRDRQNLLSALHAVSSNVAARWVKQSLQNAELMMGELDPNFQGSHVFADLNCRQTICRSCVHLVNAMDDMTASHVGTERGESRLHDSTVWSIRTETVSSGFAGGNVGTFVVCGMTIGARLPRLSWGLCCFMVGF